MQFSSRKGTFLGTLLTVLTLLSACESNDSSDSSSSSSSGNTASSSGGYELNLDLDNVQIHFPPQGVSTEKASIIVRGVVSDTTGLSQLYINDVAVDSDDALTTWQLEVPLEPGENVLTLSSKDSEGQPTELRTLNVTRGGSFTNPAELVFDTPNNRALLWDNLSRSIIAIDADTGGQTTLASLSGSGTSAITNPRGMAIDSANNRVLLYQQKPEDSDSGPVIVAVDLTTGEQETLSLQEREDLIEFHEARSLLIAGTKAYWADMEGVYVNATTGQRVTASDTTSASVAMGILYTIDFATGVKTTLSSYGTPENFVLGPVIDMCTNPTLDKLYVVDSILNLGARVYRLIAVDKSSGESDVLSVVDSNDNALDLNEPTAIECDTSTSKLYVLEPRQVIAIDHQSLVYNTLSRTGLPEDSPFPVRKAVDITLSGSNLFLVDDSLDYLLSVNTETGQRTQISGASADNTEGVASIINTADICINAEEDKAFIVDNRTLLIRSVDLTTGEKQILTQTTGDEEEGSSRLTYPVTCSMNYSDGKLFVYDNYNQNPTSQVNTAPRLLSVDRGTGQVSSTLAYRDSRINYYDSEYDENNKTLYSVENNYIRKIQFAGDDAESSLLSYNRGRNPSHPFRNIQAFGIDYQHNRLLVVDKGLKSIVAVSLTNGARSPFSNAAFPADAGPLFSQPQSIVIDRKNNRALVNDSVKKAIFAVDLETGVRQIVLANPDGSSGPLYNSRKMALHPVYGYLLLSDSTTNTVQAVDIATQQVVTLTY